MLNASRRKFIATGTTAAATLASGAVSYSATVQSVRSHPMEGIEREDIKITDVKVTLLTCEIPSERQWYTGRWLCLRRNSILVEVFTNKGVVGIGGVSMYGGPEDVKKYTEEIIKPWLIGKNPFDVELITNGGVFKREGGLYGWAGIDMACWDIIGKVKNQPVYKLLSVNGLTFPKVRLYASAGLEYAWYDRPEDLVDEAVVHKENGFTAFKFRIGTEWKAAGMTIKKYIPLLEKLRAAVGPDFDLMQEANQRWTLEQCLEIAPVLEELKFLWLEEPTRRRESGAIEEYMKIGEAMPSVMVTGGESMRNRFEIKEWLDCGAYDMAQTDCIIAGVTENWHISRIADFNGRYCCPQNWHGGLGTIANAHLEAAIPNHLILELNQTYNTLLEDVFKDGLPVRDGYMYLSDKPGFGIEIVDNIAQKFPFNPESYTTQNPEIP